MANFFKKAGKFVSKAAPFVLFGVAGGAVAHGAHQARKGAREAKREAMAQRAQFQQADAAIRAEQQRTDAQLNSTRARIAQGQARANRARVRGGLFSETAQPQGIINSRLG